MSTSVENRKICRVDDEDALAGEDGGPSSVPSELHSVEHPPKSHMEGVAVADASVDDAGEGEGVSPVTAVAIVVEATDDVAIVSEVDNKKDKYKEEEEEKDVDEGDGPVKRWNAAKVATGKLVGTDDDRDDD